MTSRASTDETEEGSPSRRSRRGPKEGSSKRRKEILDAAAELFAQNGFAGTTVRDIADSVGILSGSLYHHFNAKEDMVEEIFNAYFDELTTRLEEVCGQDLSVPEKLEAMLDVALGNVDNHTAAARLFTNEWFTLRRLPGFDEKWSRIEKTWMKVIRQGVEDGSIRGDVDPVLLFSAAMDMIRGFAGWYHPGARLSIGRVRPAYVSVLMSGLRTG